MWLNPWVGKILEGGNDNPFQYCCLKTSMDRGTWQGTVHRVPKSQLRLSTHTHIIYKVKRPKKKKANSSYINKDII